MAAPPAIDPREGLRPLFERAGIDDNFYHRYKEGLLDKDVGNAIVVGTVMYMHSAPYAFAS